MTLTPRARHPARLAVSPSCDSASALSGMRPSHAAPLDHPGFKPNWGAAAATFLVFSGSPRGADPHGLHATPPPLGGRAAAPSLYVVFSTAPLGPSGCPTTARSAVPAPAPALRTLARARAGPARTAPRTNRVSALCGCQCTELHASCTTAPLQPIWSPARNRSPIARRRHHFCIPAAQTPAGPRVDDAPPTPADTSPSFDDPVALVVATASSWAAPAGAVRSSAGAAATPCLLRPLQPRRHPLGDQLQPGRDAGQPLLQRLRAAPPGCIFSPPSSTSPPGAASAAVVPIVANQLLAAGFDQPRALPRQRRPLPIHVPRGFRRQRRQPAPPATRRARPPRPHQHLHQLQRIDPIVFIRRARRLTSMLDESTTPLATPRAISAR